MLWLRLGRAVRLDARRFGRSAMETAFDAGYLVGVVIRDDASAFLAARELIALHGDDVARVLQDKIDELMVEGDYEALSSWFVIRNAVALTLGSGTTLQ